MKIFFRVELNLHDRFAGVHYSEAMTLAKQMEQWKRVQ